MPQSLHFDLRCRVLKAIDEGLSCREAAARCGVSASAIRWAALRRAGGDGQAKLQGGNRLSRRSEAHASLIAAALADVPDITLVELKRSRQRHGALALLPPPRHNALKKTAHATEQDHPDVRRRGRTGSRANSISIPTG